jgi:hypothetical protein
MLLPKFDANLQAARLPGCHEPGQAGYCAAGLMIVLAFKDISLCLPCTLQDIWLDLAIV